jgi:hypothetical protein
MSAIQVFVGSYLKNMVSISHLVLMDAGYIDDLFKQYLDTSRKKIYFYSYHDGNVNQIMKMNLLTISIWYDLCLKNNHIIASNLTLSRMIG